MTKHEVKRAEHYFEEDEINLVDILKVVYRWRKFIIGFVAVSFIASIVIGSIKYPAKRITACTILLNFPGIEKHLNPDGSLFEKNQLITPFIVSKAIKVFEPEDQRYFEGRMAEMLRVKAIMPKTDPVDKESELRTVYSNQFTISLITKTSGKEGSLSNDYRSKLINTIITEYRKDFELKYGEEPLQSIHIPKTFIDNYDYLETINIFKTKAQGLLTFLDAKIKNTGFFRSKDSGLSFSDLKNECQILMNIDIERVDAYINTKKLTKDSSSLISKFQHKIKQIDVDKNKKEKEALVAHKLLRELRKVKPGTAADKVKQLETAGPSMVLDANFIESLRENDYYSFLVRNALEAEVRAKYYEVDKQFYTDKIVGLKAKIASVKGKQNRKLEQEKMALVEESLTKIYNELSDLTNKTNELNIEFLRRMIDGAIRVLKDPETYKEYSGSFFRIILMTLAISFLISIFFTFIIDFLKKSYKQIITEN